MGITTPPINLSPKFKHSTKTKKYNHPKLLGELDKIPRLKIDSKESQINVAKITESISGRKIEGNLERKGKDR